MHHWVLESAEEAVAAGRKHGTSYGQCKYCHSQKVFQNSIPGPTYRTLQISDE